MILLSISLFVLQKISRAVSKEIVFYLRERLHPLHVQVGEFNASFWDAMERGKLLGYCFQATEVASLVLSNSFVCRGVILSCEHAWISLDYKGKTYVLDPALNLICEQYLYNLFLEPEILATIPTSFVQQDFSLYQTHQKEEHIPDLILKRLLDVPSSSVYILGSENVRDAFYRTYTAFDGQIENDKVKSLVARFDSRK